MINVFCFDNGTTTVTGDDGQQIPELQKPWIIAVVESLQAAGHDVENVKIRMPRGNIAKFKKGEDGKLTYELTV